MSYLIDYVVYYIYYTTSCTYVYIIFLFSYVWCIWTDFYIEIYLFYVILFKSISDTTIKYEMRIYREESDHF